MIRYLKKSFQNRSSENLIFAFLLVWLLVNLVQAGFTGLHADEAYYWIYSRFLDWGYFDHPPMVAIFIKAGSYLVKNTLGLRLLTIITNTLSIYILWLIVKPYAKNAQLFILLFCSVLIFHVYAFITTPDAPLFFFTVLFLYLYQHYTKAYQWKWAVALGIVAAALLLSKYHGILLIFFILISNFSLFKKASFWGIIVIALILFAPHIYWQYLNDYPSIQYHLFDRSASPYKFEYTAQYFIDQLLMMGPLMGWLLFTKFFKLKLNNDLFLRGLTFIVYGVFVFFFFNTFKGRVQAHWPLIEFIPLFILAYVKMAQGNLKSVYRNLLLANILLIIFARLILVAAPDALKKVKFIDSYFGYEEWAKKIHQQAKGYPVVFQDGFQLPSYYNFYNQTLKGFGYNSVYYRKTQFDLWPIEDSLRNKKVFYLSGDSQQNSSQVIINTVKGEFYGAFLDSVRMYQKIDFAPLNYNENWKATEKRVINFIIYNPYEEVVSFSNDKQKWFLKLYYGFYKNGNIEQLTQIEDADNYRSILIEPKGKHQLKMDITAPKNPGNYKLFISVKTDPFPGARNSRMINMNVQ